VIGGGNKLADAADESAIGGGNELVVAPPDESSTIGGDDEQVVALVDESVTGGESIVTPAGEALASANFFEANPHFDDFEGGFCQTPTDLLRCRQCWRWWQTNMLQRGASCLSPSCPQQEHGQVNELL
jgi:hypothetical protein